MRKDQKELIKILRHGQPTASDLMGAAQEIEVLVADMVMLKTILIDSIRLPQGKIPAGAEDFVSVFAIMDC